MHIALTAYRQQHGLCICHGFYDTPIASSMCSLTFSALLLGGTLFTFICNQRAVLSVNDGILLTVKYVEAHVLLQGSRQAIYLITLPRRNPAHRVSTKDLPSFPAMKGALI